MHPRVEAYDEVLIQASHIAPHAEADQRIGDLSFRPHLQAERRRLAASANAAAAWLIGEVFGSASCHHLVASSAC